MLTRACELYEVNQVQHDKIEYLVQKKTFIENKILSRTVN